MIHEPIIAPAEELQADLPLHGATVPMWLYAVSLALGFACIAVWVAR